MRAVLQQLWKALKRKVWTWKKADGVFFFLAEVSLIWLPHLRQVIAIDGQMTCMTDIYWLKVVLPNYPLKHGLVYHAKSYIFTVDSKVRCGCFSPLFAMSNAYRNIKKCCFFDFVLYVYLCCQAQNIFMCTVQLQATFIMLFNCINRHPFCCIIKSNSDILVNVLFCVSKKNWNNNVLEFL